MKNKRGLVSKALALTMVAAISVGATFAYLTDKKSVTNTFTVGDVNITVEEPAWGTPGTSHEIAPKVAVDKDPSVKNTGKNACYVRVKVDYDKAVFELLGLDVGDTADKGWKDGGDGYYYYKTSVAATASTSKLFKQVKMLDTVKEAATGTNLNVVVNAEAVQANGFDNVDAAFAAAAAELASK
ncbi:SipW-cognate class signal peptide [Clostridium collagenovorans DSM 3089]|uniref:SipW-cognate class signal peptide n=1 Tax=Clostridium collagenovorans DSM 3089 TaxID=1121306 RepID=A0A1M5XHD2_9CLOT|nr:TasA family protein [Clostridium collagenovorans]SHH98924.1 SipW-cognate class signal peptide [Clostridium collagenovorans DSM 3089]